MFCFAVMNNQRSAYYIILFGYDDIIIILLFVSNETNKIKLLSIV